MALRMKAAERDIRKNEMIMMMRMAQQQHRLEEERMLQMVIEESKVMSDPNSPDVDNMTYEQLLDM